MENKMKAAYFLDDGQSKLDSADFSYRHLRRKQEEKSRMPEWAWNALYLGLGLICGVSLPYSLSKLFMEFFVG